MEKSRSCSEFMGRAGPSSPPRRQRGASLFLLSLLLLLLPALPIASATTSGPVLAVELQGPITPASDDIVAAALQEAEAGGFQAVMLLLDTPGGGLTETYEILRQMEETEIPVIAYVYPEGAVGLVGGNAHPDQLRRGGNGAALHHRLGPAGAALGFGRSRAHQRQQDHQCHRGPDRGEGKSSRAKHDCCQRVRSLQSEPEC